MVMTNSHWSKAGYRRILSAQALSALGDRVSYVVVPLALLGIGFHVGMVAFILGARAIAYGAVVLWGGVLADRISCARLIRSYWWLGRGFWGLTCGFTGFGWCGV
jgi:hypothetical protein